MSHQAVAWNVLGNKEMSKVAIYTPHGDKCLWWISGYSFTSDPNNATIFNSKEEAKSAIVNDADLPPSYMLVARDLDAPE
jgi:hypothetical protein